MKHKGFTIVELIVIIVVIAILASITIVGYSWMRGDSLDAKIRSVVKTVGDAIQLHESQNHARLAVTGYFYTTNGVDSLVPKYLKQGYRDGITSKNSANANQIFRWYNCDDGGNGFVVYASLNNPSSDDIAQFNKLRSACGHGNAQAPNSGSLIYNYAQVF